MSVETKIYAGEEILGKAYDARLVKRLARYLKPHMKWVALSIALMPALSGLEVVLPFIYKIAIDKYIIPGDWNGLKLIGAIYAAIMVAEAFLNYLNYYAMQVTGVKVSRDLRREAFDRLTNLSPSYYERTPVGKMTSRVTTDVEVIGEMFSSGVTAVFNDALKLILILVVLVKLDAKLALVSFSLLPLMIVGFFLFRKWAREAFRLVRERIAAINGFLGEHIQGMSVVQLLNREKETFESFHKLNLLHRDAHFLAIACDSLLFSFVEAVSLATMAIIIWYGGGETVRGVVTFGTLFAFVRYLEMFFIPIRDLSAKYTMLQSAMAGAERVFALIDTKSDVENPRDPVKPPAETKGEIVFENVSFAYRKSKDALKEIDLTVRAGERVAVVGATGAGKSSLIKLLCRFYDAKSGRILIDGVDVRDMSLGDLRSRIGLVPQEPHLLSRSMIDNITLDAAHISRERAVVAAKRTRAHTFIEAIEGGYDAMARERGSNLSAGQRQLLSFARALAFDPPVIVLDEATSNVDHSTEASIQEALKELLENRTAIVIAHRLSTIRDCDRIVVMHKGRIAEQGGHDELIAKNGIYARLYKLQLDEFKD